MNKKTYYQIEIRIGNAFNEDCGELFYYAEGYAILSNNTIEGFLANDLLYGDFSDIELFIELINIDDMCEYYSFKDKYDSIEFPQIYDISSDLKEKPDNYCIINFMTKISDVQEQHRIEEELKRVKQLYKSP